MLSKILQNYLKYFATNYLKRANCQIVAITGSVGKTSSKEAIFSVLKIKYKEKVRRSEGNLNNETGLPLAILDYKKAPTYNHNKIGWLPILLTVPFRSLFLPKVDILVLEMAADKPGDIKYLTSIAKPNIAVLTAIAPAHLEAFGKIENIVEEKTNIFRALGREGWAVINLENDLARKTFYGGWWQKKSYGLTEKSDVFASNINYSIKKNLSQTSYEIVTDKQKINITQQTIGLPAVLASLSAVAVAKILKLTNQEIVDGLANIRSSRHRTEILSGVKNSTLIDDCYNANPVSMRAGLDILKNLPKTANGRKIAIIGEMREIGKNSAREHEAVGEYAKEICDLVISVGKPAQNYKASKHFNKLNEAIEYVLSEVKENDIILIKASRGGGLKPMLEPVVEALKKEK